MKKKKNCFREHCSRCDEQTKPLAAHTHVFILCMLCITYTLSYIKNTRSGKKKNGQIKRGKIISFPSIISCTKRWAFALEITYWICIQDTLQYAAARRTHNIIYKRQHCVRRIIVYRYSLRFFFFFSYTYRHRRIDTLKSLTYPRTRVYTILRETQ